MKIIKKIVQTFTGEKGIFYERRKVFTDLLRDVRGIRTVWLLPWAFELMNHSEQICNDTISHIDGKYTLKELRTHHLTGVLKTIEALLQKQGLEREEAIVATAFTHVQNPAYPEGLLLLRLKEVIELLKVTVINFGLTKKEA